MDLAWLDSRDGAVRRGGNTRSPVIAKWGFRSRSWWSSSIGDHSDRVDFSALGVYLVQVEFIGTVRSSKNTAIDVQRQSPTLSVNVVARNPQELQNIAERLTRQIQSPEAEPALLAVRKLAYLDDPVVVSYWIRILDEQKGTRVDPIAIRALEKHGTAEARAAIDRASQTLTRLSQHRLWTHSNDFASSGKPLS